MIKIKKLHYSLKVLFGLNRSNETAYTNTEVSEDGTYVYLTNPYDPNTQDIQIEYSQVVEPVTGTITELVDVLRCWILEGIGRISIYEDSINVLGANCNALQNVGNNLYWRGSLLSGGGGGAIFDNESIIGDGSLSDPYRVGVLTDFYQEEFHFINSTAGQNSSIPAGGSVSAIVGSSTNPGVVRLQATNTGGGIISGANTVTLRYGVSTAFNRPIAFNFVTRSEYVFRLPSFAISSGYDINYRIGQVPDPFTNDGFFIAMDTDGFGGLPGEWKLVKQVGGVSMAYSFPAPLYLSAGVQYRLSIETSNSSNQFAIYLDGMNIMNEITVPAVMTDLVVGNITGTVAPAFSIQHRTTIALGVPHTLDVDYCKIKLSYPTSQLGL